MDSVKFLNQFDESLLDHIQMSTIEDNVLFLEARNFIFGIILANELVNQIRNVV